MCPQGNLHILEHTFLTVNLEQSENSPIRSVSVCSRQQQNWGKTWPHTNYCLWQILPPSLSFLHLRLCSNDILKGQIFEKEVGNSLLLQLISVKWDYLSMVFSLQLAVQCHRKRSFLDIILVVGMGLGLNSWVDYGTVLFNI